MVIKYKASDLISDFNLNAKTTLTQLSEVLGTEIKKSTVLTEEQANIAFERNVLNDFYNCNYYFSCNSLRCDSSFRFCVDSFSYKLDCMNKL